jgi:glutamate racemase
MDSRPIGVLSSGVGGLTVLEELVTAIPNEKFIFFADALRVPYGNKSTSEIIEYSLQLALWIEKQNVKLVVISCNTIASVAESFLRSKLKVPVISIVDSAVSTVLLWSNLTGEDLKRIGIVASIATISSGAHESALRTDGYSGEIMTAACPLFLPILKSGVMDKGIWQAMMDYYLAPMRDNMVQGVLLASTGFTLLSEFLHEFFDGKVQIFNPNPIFAKDVLEFLESNDLRTNSNENQQIELYTTGAVQTFDFFFHRYFDMNANSVKVVEVSSLLV